MRLGRYTVVKHLAQGGMADVLLARTNGIEGFERHVVIKRIRAEQARDARFVGMFLDEARLAASLHHHNIVQVNDIGEEDGEYFFAMEYVHGEDVRRLLMILSERGEHVPIEHVLTIATGAAAGLHHAHEQRGPDRKPLGIVHRDVSPANIMIGYDGSVKVADFGIAKSDQRSNETQSGTLKGKVAYMSPEQCVGEPVDRRSDVFALGIVLYELATTRRLFKGENDFLTMSAIVLSYIPPPSSCRPDLAPELEAIILKALANKPDDRYASADELRLALEQFAATAGIRTSSTALADYLKQQFGERPEPWLDDEDEPEIELTVDFDGSASGVVRPPVEASARFPAVATRALGGAAPGATGDAASEAAVASPILRARNRAITAAGGPWNATRGAAATHAPAVVTPEVPTPSSIVAAPSVAADEPSAPPVRRRRWVVAPIAAVIAAGIALVVAASAARAPATEHAAAAHPASRSAARAVTTPSATTPIATTPIATTPIATHVTATNVTATNAIATTPVAAAAAPPTRPTRRAAKPRSPAKHWDPNALFPE